MEQLAKYIAAGGIRQNELAKRLKLHPSVISRFLNGVARPSLDTAFAIERATNGAVPAESWVSLPDNGDADAIGPGEADEAGEGVAVAGEGAVGLVHGADPACAVPARQENPVSQTAVLGAQHV